MKKAIIALLAAATCSYATAAEHRLSLEPEIFVIDLDTQVESTGVSGFRTFGGNRLAYEYINRDVIYFAIQFQGSQTHGGFQMSNMFVGNSCFCGYNNMETRIGYPIGRDKLVITPFIGFGNYSIVNENDFAKYTQKAVYWDLGLRASIDVSPIFSIGIRAKAMASWDIHQELNYERLWATHSQERKSTGWGAEVAVPLNWLIGERKMFNIGVEPYAVKIPSHGITSAYGNKLIIGCKF